MADIFGFGQPIQSRPPDPFGFGQPPQGGLSDHQVNAYKTLLDMSSPQERQQMLGQLKQAAGSNAGAAQLYQNFQGYNQGQQQQGVYNNDLGTKAYQLGSGLVQGGLDMFIPNQTAGDVTGPNAQFDAQGRLLNPQQSLQGGHAASQLDVARQAIADRFMTKGVTEGMPGLAGTDAGVTGNFVQKGLQRGLQMAPGFMAGNAVTSFNGDGTQLTPYQQAVKTGEATLAGAGQALGFGLGGEALAAAGRTGMKGVRAVANAADSQQGSHSMFEPLNGQTPVEQAQLGQLSAKQAKAANALALQESIRDINLRPDLSLADKQKLIDNVSAHITEQNAAADKMLATHLDTLKQNGVEPIPHQAADTGATGPRLLDQQIAEDNKPTLGQRLGQGIRSALGKDNAPLSSASKVNIPSHAAQIKALVDQGYTERQAIQQVSANSGSGGSISLGADMNPTEAKPVGEQIGRLKAQIAKETDPNAKAELTSQLQDLNKRYSAQKLTAKENQVAGEKGHYDLNTHEISLGNLHDNATLVHEVAHHLYESMPEEQQGALDFALREFNEKNRGAFTQTNDPNEDIAHAAEQYLANKRQYGKPFTDELNRTTNGRELVKFFKEANDQAANNVEKAPTSNAALDEFFKDRSGVESPTVEGNPKVNAVEDAQAQKAKEDTATAEAIKQQANAPEPYQGMKDVKTWQDVRDNGASATRMSQDNVETMARQADKIFGKKADSNRLFRVFDSIEHPESLVKNAKALKVTPEELKGFIDNFKQTTDFTHSMRSGLGEAIPYRDVYGLHPWDLSDKAAQEAMNELVKSKGGAFHGSAARQRAFDTLREGKATQYKDANGIMRNFDVKKQSVGDAIREWGKQEHTAIQAAALKQSILHKDPHGFVDFSNEGQPRTPDGKPYKVSGIPGLSGWLTPEAYHETQGFRVIDTDSVGKGLARVLKAIDVVNRLGKGVELLGGAFHDVNTSLRYAAQEITSAIGPHSPIGLRGLRAIAHGFDMNRAFWDEGYHAKIDQQLHAQGWSELFAKTHLTGSQASDATMFDKIKGGNIEHLNPYSEALFSRKIDLMKKFSAMEEARRVGITDPRKATPEQIARLSGATDSINNRFGGLNLRTINRNPVVQYIFRQLALAPDFWEGKARTDLNALNALNPLNRSGQGRGASSLALRQVIGTTLLIGTIAELTRQAMGQGSKNLQQAYNNDIKDPSVPLPFKNKQGQAVVGHLPATDVSELTRAFTDPGHYVTARGAFVPSIGAEMATGKDYYGNTLTDTNTNPNPSFASNLEGALKSKGTIPGTQAMSLNNPNSTTNLPVALTNIAGLRVTRDPNDPQYQQTQQYFQARTAATKGLTANQLTQFNALFPAKKDSQGNYLPDSKFDPFNSSVTASILLKSAAGDGVVLKRVQQMNQAQGIHDPMWDLSGSGTINGHDVPLLNLFIKYQQLKADDPGSIAAKEISSNNPQIAQTEQDRSAYFQNLPQSKNPLGANPIQYPGIDQRTQELMNIANGIKDPTQKAQFIANNPTLGQAYSQLSQYTAQRQNQVMAPQFAQAPVAPPNVQAAMNAKQWNAPGVQQYMNANSAFKIAGPYGDGIGGAGGGRNTSPQAIANVSQGLSPNGKPSSYTASKVASANRSARNSLKAANKEMKYAMKKSRQNVHKISFGKSHLEASLAKALLPAKVKKTRIA